MTLSELLTDLNSKPDIIEVLTPSLVSETENVKRYDVPIVRLIRSDTVEGATQPVLTVDEGEAGEEAYYNIKRNFKDAVRDQLYTDQQYIDGLEGEFTGWTVLSLSVKIDGDTDILSVRASDGSNIIDRKVGVWNNDLGEPEWKLFEQI